MDKEKTIRVSTLRRTAHSSIAGHCRVAGRLCPRNPSAIGKRENCGERPRNAPAKPKTGARDNLEYLRGPRK